MKGKTNICYKKNNTKHYFYNVLYVIFNTWKLYTWTMNDSKEYDNLQ